MEIRMKDRQTKRPRKLIYTTLLLLALFTAGYFIYTNLNTEKKELDIPTSQNISKETEQKGEESDVPEEDCGCDDPQYEEFFPIIDEQQAYVVIPKRTDKEKPLVLIIYSHGSNTTVTQNMEDQFMKDLQLYGKFLIPYNYIFAASNQHGANWGNSASIQDTLNLREWVEDNYDIQPKIYLLGFSMGGLPTMNFATTYPELIQKIALLAPTTKSSAWDSARVEKIMDMDIKIWHGNKDVNVPYSGTVSFLSKIKSLGKDIELITVEGKGHFDIDTEYMEDILEFFSN